MNANAQSIAAAGTTHDNDPLLSQKSVARLLCVSPRALEAWRTRGGGPTFVRISARCIRYRLSDVQGWIANRTCQQ